MLLSGIFNKEIILTVLFLRGEIGEGINNKRLLQECRYEIMA